MSRASITSKGSLRLSKHGSTVDTHEQSAHLDEQLPPEKNTIPSTDDEKKSCEPLVVTSPGFSNSGSPQQPGPHVQESTSNDSPKGASAVEAQKVVGQEDQPSPSEIVNVMRQVLEVLKDSTIASKTGKDDRSRFWGLYKRVAEEHDDEFLEQYNSDMDIVLIFSGLFSAVSTAFIVVMESNLSPNPNDTTNALLTQLVQIGLGNFTAAGSTPASPASTWSPSTTNIRIQCIAYASLCFSLLAAFGAVLGKQWLGYYKSHRYGRGSEEERAKRRQEKFDGMVTWYFDGVVQSFPVLLQLSLLLFGIALSANMWSLQYTIAWVIVATTVFGFLFYSLTVMAALVSPACPFQTPISTILRVLRVDEILRPMVISASRYLQQLVIPVHSLLQPGLEVLHYLFYRDSYGHYVICRIELSEQTVFAVRTFACRCLHPLFGALQRLLPSRRSPTRVVDFEAQPFEPNLDVVATNQCLLSLDLRDVPTSSLDAPSVKWLLETSTDPGVFLTAANLVPHVDWPLDLDVSDTLQQLYDVYTSCLDVQNQIIPTLEEKASACTMALSHLYCNHILQGHPAYGFSGYDRAADCYVFHNMLGRTKAIDNVLVATIKLFFAKYAPPFELWPSPTFRACPNHVLEWLSQTLPFHFVTGRVDEDVENLAITVISQLLCSSPSRQIMANCTFLACIMVGVQFDKKDIVRVDKSSALPQLTESLWAQFQRAIWSSDRGEPDSVVRKARDFDIIFRALDCDLLPRPKSWNLEVCWKIYSRARSSEHNDQDPSAALRKVQRLGFNIFSYADPADPAWLWQHQISWKSNSHSPEDFDWLVDYLDVCSDNHETAGDILILLSSMTVSCSLAKQRLYIEKLIACMSSSMSPRLRHAALCAAHNSREVLASMDVVDDLDMVLTNLSSAILTAVCPQPGAIPTSDGPDRFFDDGRDLRYLELIFALARNSSWRPYLHFQMDRTIRMVAVCSESGDRHAFYLIGIFHRMTSEEVSTISLSSITEQQWWDMMRKAWFSAVPIVIENIDCIELLPDFVERTKKSMCNALKPHLEQLIQDVDCFIETLESRSQLEQRERVAVTAMKELRGIATDKLDNCA